MLLRASIAVSMSLGLGNHGGDGRASLLFFFDYSIISGRFGANGSVFPCYSMWRLDRCDRRYHVTKDIIETGYSLTEAQKSESKITCSKPP